MCSWEASPPEETTNGSLKELSLLKEHVSVLQAPAEGFAWCSESDCRLVLLGGAAALW